MELQLRAERAGREASANQLLKAEDGLGEREAAWEAQRQILVQDAERLREELSEVGRERDNWRLKIEAMGKSPISGSSSYVVGDSAPPSSGAVLGSKLAEYLSERKAYEAEIAELSVTCNALREEVRVKEESISEERRCVLAKFVLPHLMSESVLPFIAQPPSPNYSCPSPSISDHCE